VGYPISVGKERKLQLAKVAKFFQDQYKEKFKFNEIKSLKSLNLNFKHQNFTGFCNANYFTLYIISSEIDLQNSFDRRLIGRVFENYLSLTRCVGVSDFPQLFGNSVSLSIAVKIFYTYYPSDNRLIYRWAEL